MALTTCKECNGQVSTAASTCPHCGAPVSSAAAPRTQPPQPDYRQVLGVVVTPTEIRTPSRTIPFQDIQRVEVKSIGMRLGLLELPLFIITAVALAAFTRLTAEVGLKGLICLIPTLLAFLYSLAQVARLVYQAFLAGGTKELHVHARGNKLEVAAGSGELIEELRHDIEGALAQRT